MTLPTLFVPHGGGPCFFMDPDGGPPDPMWQPMQAYLAGLIASLPERPRAILLVSGHWEEDGDHAPYRRAARIALRLSRLSRAHLSPALGRAGRARRGASRGRRCCRRRGSTTREERERGWDHGVFIPMKVAVPDADIPLVQMSLRADLDPADHIAIGRALAPLRDEGVLIVGSGMSFHNLRVRGPQAVAPSAEWDAALTDAVTDPDPARRAERVADWADAAPRQVRPSARGASAAADGRARRGRRGAAVRDHASEVLGWAVSGYRFG